MKTNLLIGLILSFQCLIVAQNQNELNVSTLVKPGICMVTVNKDGSRNEIVWTKKLYPDAQEFLIYRVTIKGKDSLVGRIAASEPSIFTDSDGKDGTGNPELSSHVYKMSYADKNSKESELSDPHETIHVKGDKKGNFSWNAYTGYPLVTKTIPKYALYRLDPSGKSTLILETEKTEAVDPDFEKYANKNYHWYILLEGFACESDPSDPATRKNGTKSNNSNE